MKRKYYQKVISILLSTGIIASLAGYPINSFAQNNDTIENALKSMKSQNLKTNIDILKNIQIDPQIDTSIDKEIKVIVQLKGDVSNSNADKVKASHTNFKKHIEKLNKSKKSKKIKVKEEYTQVFNGMSLTINALEVNDLLDSNEVQKVWLDQTVSIDPVIEKNAKAKTSKEETKVDSVIQIEANKLHEENITGKGVKVGVIDTGLDYNHPDLKDNYKGGYDCVNEDDDPMETTYKDWQESGELEYQGQSTYYTEHGTHVTGSIAGSGRSNLAHAVKGVAPEADIYGYKVLGPYGSGSFSDVIQGIEMSVNDKMDVINLSLGADANDPYSPVAQAVNNAMLKGTMVVMAAGNSGPSAGTVGTPGVASFPIAVGASSASVTRNVYEVGINDKSYEIKSIAQGFDENMSRLKDEELEVVYVAGGEEYEYKNLGVESVEGKVVLINYKFGNLSSKIKLASSKGAKAVILYGQYREINIIDEDKDYVPTFEVIKAVGEEIKASIDSGQNKMKFSSNKEIVDGTEELAWFSSQGPGYYEFDIKPDVVAPGVSVYSSVPSYVNDKENNNYDYAYERMNGTSMASPHVAGAAALIKQANKKATPFDIKKALMNTSEKLDKDYGVNQVGSGRINVYDAVNSNLVISIEDSTKIYDGEKFIDIKKDTGSLAFGSYGNEDAQKGVNREKQVNIKNTSNKEKTYTIDVEYFNNYPAENSESNNVKLNIDKEISINKKSEKFITASLEVPKDAQKGSYQGYITLTNKSDKEEKHQIPFSINYSEEGIKEVEHLREGTSTKYDELFDSLVEAGIEFSSHMTEIGVFVQDYNTKKIIGISGAADISGVPINTPLRLGAFNGIVLPIDENGNVGSEFVRLGEGDYNIVYVTKDSLGREYRASDYVWVDNTTPELSFDKVPGVYELEDNQTSFNIKGKSYDAGIENVMKKTDTYLDQSWTNVYKYEHNNFVSLEMAIPEVDGSFEMTHNIDNSKDINKIAVSAIDIFGAGSLREKFDYYVVKKGTPYIYSSFDKTRVNKNDEFNMNISMNNIVDFENGKFDFRYINNHEILEVKLNDEFINLAKEQGYEFEITLEDLINENDAYNVNKINLNTKTKGSEKFNISKKVNVFDIKLRATKDVYYNPSEMDVFEECLIKNARVNDDSFENVLNTSFIYNIAK